MLILIVGTFVSYLVLPCLGIIPHSTFHMLIHSLVTHPSSVIY